MSELSSGRPTFGQEDLSLPVRLLRVFYAPRSSFSAVVGREGAHDWLLPVLLACLVGLLAHQLTIDLVTDPDSPAVKEQLAKLDEEQRAQYLQGMEMLRTQGWMMVPVGLFSSLVVVAGVALLLARRLSQGEVTFRQTLVVKAYASLVLIPEWCVHTPLMLAKGSPDVRIGPGAFVPAEMAKSFFGRLLNGISPFDLWQVWIMGVGISVMTGMSERRAVISLLILWGVWVLGGAAVETISPGIAPPPGSAPVP